MVTKKKTEGSLHYLGKVSPRVHKKTQGIESLIQNLGKRLGSLEKEIQQNLMRLQKDLVPKIPLGTKENAKVQDEIKNLKNEFNAQIRDISKALEAELDVKIKKPEEPSLLHKIFNVIPNPLKLLTQDGAEKEFEKILHEDIDPFGRDPACEEKVRPIFDFLYKKYWRITTHGLENIPTEGRGLLVSNHSGTLAYDGTMIRVAVQADHPAGRDVRFLVEDFVYYLPFVGTFMYRCGGVRASRENAERLLNSDHLVAVFPEGVKGIGKYYSQRYHLQRFGRGGFIKLAIRTKSPIIPVAVIGAEEIHPILYKSTILAKPLGIPYIPITPTLPLLGPLGFLPLPTKWSIYFGKPIDFSGYGPATLKNELKIHKLSEMVRQNIQDMVTAGLKKRRSVWFG